MRPLVKTILVVLAVVSVVGVSYATVLVFGQPATVGIVRMDEVLQKYQGAIDARTAYERNATSWQENIDTLKEELQGLVLEYERDRSTMSQQQRVSYESLLGMKQQQIQEYAAAIQQRATDEQLALTKQLVSHVRSASERTALAKNLALIIAVHDDALVLYQSDAIDVTSDVLGQLKSHYGKTSEGSEIR